ncbi:MAG: transglutaminase domain-containing protein, partial [Coprococcus sp.]
LRASGLSARYVTGYAIPSSAWHKSEKGGYEAEILECYGHAWAEVYNWDNNTWIIAETTPGYSGNIENVVKEEEVIADTASEEVISETESEELSEVATEEEKSTNQVTKEQKDAENTENNGAQERNMGTDEKAYSYKADKTSSVIIGLIIAAVIIILCLILLCIRRRIIVIRRNKYFRSRDRRSAIYRMSETIYEMILFSHITDKIVKDDVEYVEEMGRKLDFLKEGEFEKFSEQVQAAVYGDVVPKAEDMQRYFSMYRLIRMHLYLGLSMKNRFVWKLIRCYD